MIFMNGLMLISAVGFFVGGLYLIDEDKIKRKIKYALYFAGVPLTCVVIVDLMSLFIIISA
jgi:hypothetical protein